MNEPDFMEQKHAEFERLMASEYPRMRLDKTGADEYVDLQTAKMWSFWLQAYWAGTSGLIERPLHSLDRPAEAVEAFLERLRRR